ncbi:hypothetical protein LY76DRAFT_354599 [Colletotrichum caudatum]|nr:hypothetical protein LY76DRAFT_354599 [Colletotrichum caudatum]
MRLVATRSSPQVPTIGRCFLPGLSIALATFKFNFSPSLPRAMFEHHGHMSRGTRALHLFLPATISSFVHPCGAAPTGNRTSLANIPKQLKKCTSIFPATHGF